jgi:hypothetical protein
MLLLLLSAFAMPLDDFDSAAEIDHGPDELVVLPAGTDFDGWHVVTATQRYGRPVTGEVMAPPLDGAPRTFVWEEPLISSSQYGFARALDVGDLDGDGLPDLLVARDGAVHIFYGGSHIWPSNLGLADATIGDDVPNGGLGLRVKVMPDTTGDGLNDIIISQIRRSVAPDGTRYSAVWLVPGGRYAGSIRIDQIMNASRYDGETNDDVGSRVSWMEDIDGDLLPEIVVSRYVHTLTVLLSSQRAPTQGIIAGAVQLQGIRSSYYVHTMTQADVDGDGYKELVVEASERDHVAGGDPEGAIYVVPRSLPWVPGSSIVLPPRASIWWVPNQSERLGRNLVGVPDIDGDGDDEVAACSKDPTTGEQMVVLLRGGPRLAEPGVHTPRWDALTRTPTLQLDEPILAVGDADGDGRNDLVFSAFYRSTPNRYALLRFGL